MEMLVNHLQQLIAEGVGDGRITQQALMICDGRIKSSNFVLDAPISISLPPKETKSAERRRATGVKSSRSTPSESSASRSSNLKRTRSIALTAHHLLNSKNTLVVDGSKPEDDAPALNSSHFPFLALPLCKAKCSKAEPVQRFLSFHRLSPRTNEITLLCVRRISVGLRQYSFVTVP
ncbi:unnamed protein product [Toxocara canis]|uniref:Uncharacterized protein n=1 Tax=Toxocara canis TaxID=6265 RepID=A0A183U109_TOXCA|nr:unnamed protein product [Toxocara canis]